MNYENKLKELNITLPEAKAPVGNYVAAKISGKILFIEDLDEYLYHIDRMIMSFKRNEKLNQLKGMIVGGMNDMNDNKIPFGKTAEQIIFDYTKDYNFPICFNFPAGHLQDNRTIILGAKSKLEITERKVIFSNNFQ